ncbi:metallophosphoesterase family protein [Dictyoglomus thermophilum]|uniref:Nuclease SbcD, putative n=1 Tax=Dictyoglomus thermophilum (strain ATCC 35947 / DSM 3960 / H-6-12) TaxID=309799 RepID=B5YA62_DICT6|nr:DNA repair exonuclease [Dictyoglomus thermophilum]ACI18380.1 nuclease SbcD, putative [Dictyoglomus thermophilum H-6-12]
MIKIVITADNHLGKYYKKLLPERLQERRKRLRNVFEEVVNYAIEEKADIFIHAGDLFDSSTPRNQDLTFIAREFSKMVKNNIKIYAIGGNHDAPNMLESDSYPIRIFEEAGLIKTFSSQSTISYEIFEKDNISILVSGLSHDPRKKGKIDPLEKNVIVPPDFPKENNLFKILILHYSFEKFAHPKAQEPQVSTNTLYDLPFDLYILGHLHEQNTYRFANKHVIIPGSTERFDFGEENLKPGFYLLTIEKGRINYEHIELNVQPMKNLEIKLTEIPQKEPTNSIIERIIKNSHKDLLLKCKLVGEIPLSMYQSINFSKILEAGINSNFLFDLDTQNLRIKGEEINTLPAPELSVDKNLEIITKKYIEEVPEDREIILEALKWIKEELKSREIIL